MRSYSEQAAVQFNQERLIAGLTSLFEERPETQARQVSKHIAYFPIYPATKSQIPYAFLEGIETRLPEDLKSECAPF